MLCCLHLLFLTIGQAFNVLDPFIPSTTKLKIYWITYKSIKSLMNFQGFFLLKFNFFKKLCQRLYKTGKVSLGQETFNICILYGKTNTIIDIWDMIIIAYYFTNCFQMMKISFQIMKIKFINSSLFLPLIQNMFLYRLLL